MGCGGNIFAQDISQNIMQTAEDKDEVSHYSKSATCRKVYKIWHSYNICAIFNRLYVMRSQTLFSLNLRKKACQTLNLRQFLFTPLLPVAYSEIEHWELQIVFFETNYLLEDLKGETQMQNMEH